MLIINPFNLNAYKHLETDKDYSKYPIVNFTKKSFTNCNQTFCGEFVAHT